MNQSLPSPKADELERELRDQLDRIRDENLPDRLLHLARDLQDLLRQRPGSDT